MATIDASTRKQNYYFGVVFFHVVLKTTLLAFPLARIAVGPAGQCFISEKINPVRVRTSDHPQTDTAIAPGASLLGRGHAVSISSESEGGGKHDFTSFKAAGSMNIMHPLENEVHVFGADCWRKK